ncbi:MAG: hypothetical protein MR739_11255 [Spirochaetia bacterium]|nr:hypothetical protein [Spirochaetia bacterium]
MKNKFIRLFAYLCFTLIFMSCNNIVTESESNSDLKSGNVIISLKSEPARTITPVNGSSYLDVAEWTVTFKETSANGYDDIVRKLTKESSINVTIPVGAFDVILEGTIEATTPIPYYGKSSFEITGNETEAVSVPVTVAPKKTEGGKGSFEYTLTVEDLPTDPTLTPVLIPYGASNTPISLDAVLNGNVFTITGSEIPSGFYTFSIKLTADGKTKEIFDTFDNLVEILDDTKTSDAKTVSYVYEGEKSYYVSCSPDAAGNGVFLSMPAYYDDILSKNDTVATVKLNFVDIDDTCPQIDVSKLQNKTYQINNSYGDNIYTISKNSETGITVTSLAPSYTISFIDSTKIEDLSTTTVTIDQVVKILKLSLGGGVTVNALKATSVSLCNTEYIDSYAITKNPFVTVDSATTVSLSSKVTTFDVVSITEGSNKNWYLAYVGEVDLTLTSNSIPNFTIVDSKDSTDVSRNSYYAGDSVTLKASPVSSFGAGTTFIWYVNGIEQTSETDSLSLTFGQGDTDVNNKIMCIACLNGEYKSVLAEIKAVEQDVEQIALLYSVGESVSSTYAGYTIISDSTTDITNTMGDFVNYTSSSETSNKVIDTFIDSEQNVYTLYQDSGKYYYSESIFTGNGYESPIVYNISIPEGATIPTLYQIKKGLDGSIYLLSGIQSSYTISSIIKDDTNPNTVTLEQKVSPISKAVFTRSSRTTFFVDETGNIYYISETTENTDVTEGETTTSTTTNTVNLMKQNNDGKSQIVTEIMSFDSLGYDVVSVRGILDGKMYYEPGNCPEFTDMRIIGGKLYLLIRHLSKIYGYSYSTGCVVCVNLSDNLDNKATVYGWDDNKCIKGTSESGETTYSYVHDNNTFYGPDKIVAIKPKQIVIADDGVEHASGNDGKNKQRLVVFDLQENSITKEITITSPDTIQFSCNHQGSFFF